MRRATSACFRPLLSRISRKRIEKIERFGVKHHQILAALAQGKTLTEIGQTMYMTHPAVSRSLHIAERKTGLALVERDGRRLRLTASGVELAGVIQGAIECFCVIDDAIQELQRGDTGTVRVLANSTPANYIGCRRSWTDFSRTTRARRWSCSRAAGRVLTSGDAFCAKGMISFWVSGSHERQKSF